jgi:hypothetical protein
LTANQTIKPSTNGCALAYVLDFGFWGLHCLARPSRALFQDIQVNPDKSPSSKTRNCNKLCAEVSTLGLNQSKSISCVTIKLIAKLFNALLCFPISFFFFFAARTSGVDRAGVAYGNAYIA